MVSENKEFKVGDKVRLANGNTEYGIDAGKVYEVESISRPTDFGQWIDLVGRSNAYSVDNSYLSSSFDLVPAWQPKVGDRVRMIRKRDGEIAACAATVERITAGCPGYLIKFDEKQDFAHGGNVQWFVSADDIEPIPSPAAAPVVAQAQPAALKIEAGKTYRSCKGNKVGPMEFTEEGWFFVKGAMGAWRPDGLHDDGETERRLGDLVSLWEEPLRIEAGRYYKTRDGRKVGPAEANPYGYFAERGFSWRVGTFTYKPDGSVGWSEDGDDIIAEWVDEPATDVATDNVEPARFKVGDRVRLIDNVASFQKFGMEGRIVSVYSDDRADVDYAPHPAGQCTEAFKDIELAPTAIVALIEDGQPKPATRPRIHPDTQSATAEASRLALEHPGQRFGVFVLADSKIADVAEEVVKKTVLRAA